MTPGEMIETLSTMKKEIQEVRDCGDDRKTFEAMVNANQEFLRLTEDLSCIDTSDEGQLIEFESLAIEVTEMIIEMINSFVEGGYLNE